MEQTLKQQVNQVEIVGILKSHDLEVKASRKDGSLFISGKAKIEVEEGGRTNVHTVSVFAKAGNKIYDGFQTVINEYKSTEQAVEETGDQNAKGDRIKVRGNLDLEEYISTKTEQLTSFNQIKGVFFNRIKQTDKEFNMPDYTKVLIELNISSITPKVDTSNLPTGELLVEGFNVGYNQKIIPLFKLEVAPELTQAFQAYFRPQTTAQLSMRLENYAVEKEKSAPQVSMAAFGQTFNDIGERVVYDYVNRTVIVGGDAPYTDFRNLTPEQHELAKKLRQQAIDTLAQPTPATTGFTEGFGSIQQPTEQRDLKNAVNSIANQMPGMQQPPFNNQQTPFTTGNTPNF